MRGYPIMNENDIEDLYQGRSRTDPQRRIRSLELALERWRTSGTIHPLDEAILDTAGKFYDYITKEGRP